MSVEKQEPFVERVKARWVSCTSSVIAGHSGSSPSDQATCFGTSFSAIGTTGGSYLRPSVSRSA